ncbi:prepilin-type N-terminal cleavage/methylation domain-containing protein [Verrucomicrobiota bacterium sgz303538]
MEKQLVCAGKKPHRSSSAGFSFVEALIAISIIAISLGALMTLNGQQLRVVKIARDTNAATLYQQERVEQLRQMRWPDLTSSDFVANTYMRNRPRSKAALDQISETVTIAAYPVATQGSKALRVDQSTDGTATVDSTQNGFALANERLVRVDLLLKWKGADGRQRERSTATLISDSGITRNSLPAMGAISGGVNDPFANLPATNTTTSTGTGNGNGNGNGNGTNNGGNNGNQGNNGNSQGTTANPNGKEKNK